MSNRVICKISYAGRAGMRKRGEGAKAELDGVKLAFLGTIQPRVFLLQWRTESAVAPLLKTITEPGAGSSHQTARRESVAEKWGCSCSGVAPSYRQTTRRVR